MVKQTLLSWAAICICISLHAQQTDFSKDYNTVEAQGEVPEVFLRLSKEKYEEALEKDITGDEARKTKKSKEEFLLSSNYKLNNFLLSGNVLFGDPLTQYVNDVADVILADEPELRKELSFFVVKDPAVNAAATHQGYVFINMGMLAQVQNEAQLAYIIGHEVAHYTEEHVLTGHLERTEIKKDKTFKDLRKADRISLMSTYSKEKEFEADDLGLKRILKTDYSTEKCFGIFDVMQYSYLPYDEVAFDKSFFESGDYILPDEYFLEELQEIKRSDDYDDSKSTHPNTRKRREQFIDASLDYDSKGKAFIVSEERFHRVRNMARLELSNIYLTNRDYANAIYNAYLNLKDFPENRFAKLCMGKALYSIAKYKKASRKREVLPQYKKIEGNVQQVYHFLDEIDNKELSILAARYLTLLKEEYPDDEAVTLFANDAVKSLVSDHDLSISYFESEPRAQESDEDIEEDEEDLENLSKYEKIKRMRKKSSKVEEYYRYAFVGLRNEGSYFEKRMEYCEKNYSPEPEKDLSHLSWKERLEHERKKNENNDINPEAGSRRLGIEEVVIVDPFYVSVDFRSSSDEKIRFLKSEEKQIDFYDKIKKSADAANLRYKKLNSKDMSSGATDTYNNLAFLNSWFSERLEHENLDILLSQADRTKNISAEYNTNYFYYTGVLHGISKKNSMDYYSACVTAATCIGLPIAIYQMVKKTQNTIHFNYLFNLNTGGALLVQTNKINDGDRQDILKQHLYDVFYQIKKEKK